LVKYLALKPLECQNKMFKKKYRDYAQPYLIQEEPQEVAPFRVGKTTNPESEEGRLEKPGVMACQLINKSINHLINQYFDLSTSLLQRFKNIKTLSETMPKRDFNSKNLIKLS